MKVNGIEYHGREDLERAAMDMGDEGHPYRVRKGDWRGVYGYGPKRVGGGDPTPAAARALCDAAIEAAQWVDRNAPEFFTVEAERYAILSEVERLNERGNQLTAEANELFGRAREVARQLEAVPA